MGSFADWIQSTALALGGPGLFIIAFLDSSFLSLPEINDLLLIWMVTQHKARMPYYAAASMLGSVAGCLVLYYVGRVSEQWVAKRFNADRLERTMKTFQRYGVMAVLVPSLLPPPAPFKVFVLLAGVAGIRASSSCSWSPWRLTCFGSGHRGEKPCKLHKRWFWGLGSWCWVVLGSRERRTNPAPRTKPSTLEPRT
jgi:membrane protein YqaA with SNARE-associated domain